MIALAAAAVRWSALAVALADEPAGTPEPVEAPAAEKRCASVSAERIGWATAAPDAAPTTDATARFRELYEAARVGPDDRHGRVRLPAEAAEHRYFLVKGLFGDHLPGYFRPAKKRLKRLGLRVKIVNVDTDVSVLANAQEIARVVEKVTDRTGDQAVIVGHSKGGVDALAAVALYPELAADVRAVVTLQSPYGGSPVAEDVEACPGLKFAAGVVTKGLLWGDPASVKDLTYGARQAFVAAHPLPKDLAVVSVATSDPAKPHQLLYATASYLEKTYGRVNDGLVVPEDAVVPGSRVVRLEDMSHPESVIKGLIGNYEAAAVTEAAIELVLSP